MMGVATLACFAFFGLTGCGATQTAVDAPPAPIAAATPEPSSTTIESDINDMKTAGLDHVFVLRRKDGGVFDAEDRQHLRDSMPMEINRRVSADGGRAFVLGSAFIVPKDTVTKWRARFSVEERGASSGAARSGR